MEADKLLDKYDEYFVSVLETADKKDPATILAVAELAKGYKNLRSW